MTAPIGGYTFLPWLRSGVSNLIATADGDPSVRLRATIDVGLEVVGEHHDGSPFTSPLERTTVPLVGPGDIVGIDPRAIVRTDPRSWITNYEPEFLAAIEFYDEDFPWRYTPAGPDTPHHRLRPWLALVVLAEGEFGDIAPDAATRRLPSIRVTTPALLPPLDELWAWAHVHVMRPLVPGTVVNDGSSTVLAALGATLRENPDLACSRLLAPRRLMPDTAYHAFLVPSFERGRLAGLGADPDVAPHATIGAWEAYTARSEGESYPYYYRWFFRTGAIGDFEYLVKLLQPRPVDARVGTRDVDVLDPGANLPPIDDPALAGVLKLGGALRVPRSSLSDAERAIVDRYEGWAQPYPRPIQRKLADFVNLADAYAEKPADAANLEAGFVDPDEADQGDPDPMVTAPLYARWHALTQRLLTKRDGTPVDNPANWVHELNLDPRHRVAADFGTQVIQNKQEELMQGAWDQVGNVLAANQVVRWAQLAQAASVRWYARSLQPLVTASAERVFALTAPVHARIVRDGTTVLHATRTSVLSRAAASAPLRRLARPRARLVRSLPFTAERPLHALIRRIAVGEVSAAPSKERPPGVVTLNDVAHAVETVTVPGWARALLDALPSAPTTVLIIAIALALLFFATMGGVGLALGIGVIGAGAALRTQLSGLARSRQAAAALAEPAQTPTAIDATPPAPGFRLDDVSPTPTTGSGDSPDAARLKRATRDVAVIAEAGAGLGGEPARTAIDVPSTAAATLNALDPTVTIRARTWRVIRIPDRIRNPSGGALREVMYYPEFDVAMYRPLVDLSSELFLPNLNLIPPNSITLLETNQRFIEAYMVGLNHEFSRELLWREYPTDARGSYFRQFWDVTSYVDTQGRTREELREALRDIPPIHSWLPASALGDHDNREAERGPGKDEVVLVIRGELLKRYPTAVIYAHRAEWPRVGDVPGGPIDHTRQRDLVDVVGAEVDNPPPQKVRLPLYEAKVDPDIYFFGFDLTAEAVKGGSGDTDTDDPGWFFVIKERPGEPRFGFDDGPASAPNSETPQVWNDLTWGDVAVAPGGIIRVAALPTLALKPVPSSSPDDDKRAQHDEDVAIAFSSAMNSADLAYVLFQAPVLVAVHGAEMLRQR
jgi:hypothetical protein